MGPEDYLLGAGTFGGAALDTGLVDALRTGPLPGKTDVDAAIALARLVETQLTNFGTRGLHKLADDSDMQAMLFTLRAVLRRLGIDVDIPFRDYTSFRNHWRAAGASGSWSARVKIVRDLLAPSTSSC